MSNKIGIIAEDKSDIEVIEQILSKYMERKTFTIRSFVGQGCGKLKSKCASWTDNLFKAGCQHVLVFHDLDRNKEKILRQDLEKKLKGNENTLIVIPIEELEAWLLSDPEAIKRVFSLKALPRIAGHCEAIPSPKEYLSRLLWNSEKKRYLNTVHNAKISAAISLERLKLCSSFACLDDYLTENF